MNPKTVQLLKKVTAKIPGTQVEFRGAALTLRANGGVNLTFSESFCEQSIVVDCVELWLDGHMITALKQDGFVEAGQHLGFNCNLDKEGIRELESKFLVVAEKKFRFYKKRKGGHS